MEKTNNENISPSIEFNVERVAKVLFALKDEDDLLYLQEDDFKLLDREGNLTSNYDENIFIQFAKGGAGGFGSNELIRQFFPEEFKDNLSFSRKEIQVYLEKYNIQTRPIFSGNSLRHPAFSSLINNKNKLNSFKNSDYIMKYGLLIGCHQGLSIKDIKYIHTIILNFTKKKFSE